MNRLRLPIFFMHIPKCAGKSVHALLTQKIDASHICPQPPYGVWTWRADEVRGYELYSGHFSVDFINEVNPNGTKLTTLRHPVDRVISTYDFWRSYRWDYIRTALPPINGPAIAKASSLSVFLATDSEFVRRHIHNAAARQLLGSKFEAIWPDKDALILEAREVLRGFDWVGVTEAFEQSLRSLSKFLGLRAPRSEPREGLTYDVRTDSDRERVDKSQPTVQERGRILDDNQVDLALYEEACALLQQGTNYRVRPTNRIFG
jgi:Sulfotransferase family